MEAVQLPGIQYLVDKAGKPRSVLISLDEWGDLWEDVYDVIVSRVRLNEPTVSWDTLKAEAVGEI